MSNCPKRNVRKSEDHKGRAGICAVIVQWVERMTCNHLISVRVRMMAFNGRYANWLKQAVCKTVTLETLLVRIQPYRFFIYFGYQ